MARWKLNEAHYLFGYPPDLAEEGTQWEYKETDRISGRERRKRFKVPFYFPADTVVCQEGKGQKDDFVFEGDPTPAMEPIDAEARAISEELRPNWKDPMGEEVFPGQGIGDAIALGFEKQIEKLLSLKAPAPVSTSGVSREEFDALRAQLAEMMAQKAEQPKAGPKVTRRI